jgi:selenocysteine-specific translation elongation factor
MQQLAIGLFHDDNLAKELGKKATESDMVFTHRKLDDHIFSFVYPIDDKIMPKSQIMGIIDTAIISAETITPALGETILMVDKLNLSHGLIIIPPYSDTAKITSMISGTSLKNFKLLEKNPHQIIDELQRIPLQRNDTAPCVVTIDHSFHVKGIGEVILGFVKQGTINKHDKLFIYPQEKEVIIRSIQIQDNDYATATAGSRVGLALKGVSIDDLKRGYLIAAKDSVTTSKNLTLSFQHNPYYKGLKTGQYHLSVGMQTVPVTINDLKENSIQVTTAKPVSFTPSDTFFLLDLNAEKLHFIGSGKIQENE